MMSWDEHRLFFDEVLGVWCHLWGVLLEYTLYGGFYKSKHNLLKEVGPEQFFRLQQGAHAKVINPSLFHLLFLMLSHYININ